MDGHKITYAIRMNIEDEQTCRHILKKISPELRRDPDIVIAAIEYHEAEFFYAAEELRRYNNRVIDAYNRRCEKTWRDTMEMGKQDPNAVIPTGAEYYDKKRLLDPTAEPIIFKESTKRILEQETDEQKIQVALDAIKQYSWSIKYLPQKIQENPTIKDAIAQKDENIYYMIAGIQDARKREGQEGQKTI